MYRILLLIFLFFCLCDNKNSKDIVEEKNLDTVTTKDTNDIVRDRGFDFKYDGPTCLEDIQRDFGIDSRDIVRDNYFDKDISDITITDIGTDTDITDLSFDDRVIDAGIDLTTDDINDVQNDTNAPCPPDMVFIDLGYHQFCIDIYEASRPDATSTSPGVDNSYATSRPGVIPWYPVDINTARRACENAGKRLCYDYEWFPVCTGPDNTVYCYGDDYEPTICNGIDTFCQNPYPGCYWDEENVPFHVTPTGSFPECTNEYGVYDINGNVWEWVEDDSGGHPRGGAYNCGNSERLHRCDYIPTFNPSAKGFRCCKDVTR